MDTYEAIMSRRSIRTFEDKPVPAEMIEKVLRAAMAAPSAGNEQPWEFVLVTDRKALVGVTEIHPHCEMAREAGFGVLVCGNLQKEVHRGFWIQDCSACTENLLLAAHALGLGAVWTAVHPNEDRVRLFRREFGLPEHIVPLAFVPVGWPGENPGPCDRYEPSAVHRGRW